MVTSHWPTTCRRSRRSALGVLLKCWSKLHADSAGVSGLRAENQVFEAAGNGSGGSTFILFLPCRWLVVAGSFRGASPSRSISGSAQADRGIDFRF
jgi:hypothetical protein